MNTQNENYRNQLIAAEQKSQDDYDKTIVSLSGGALGITLLFIENVVRDATPVSAWALITAWSLWALSLTAVVVSYFFSRLALRKTIEQCDKNDYSNGVGGWATTATHVANGLSGAFFVVGVVFIIIFCSNNLGDKIMVDSGNNSGTKGITPPPPPVIIPSGQPGTGVVPPPPPPSAPPAKPQK